MKTFCTIKNHFGYCIREWISVAVIWSYNKSGTYECIMGFREAVHSCERFVKFCTVQVKLFTTSYIWLNYFLDERVAFNYALDFELER